jgi:serine/threonine-protein kinase
VDGTPFGRYRLIELIGRGGMGEVWRAYDPTMDRMVALKLLPANFAGDKVFQERFRREARAAAGLDDPHIVPFHDFGEVDGRLYVTMRLIKGRDLQTMLADGPLSPVRAVRIIEQVAQALHAAHEVGLVHRDVKPSNILLDKNDFAYLIDFGIARAAGETGLTSTGAAIGTWAYMSPERLNTGHADVRADIYALTCVLHEALTGQRPFPGDSLERQIVGHLTSPPPRPSMLQPAVPQSIDAVIARGMAKQPDSRYATTVELADAARDAITAPITRPTAAPTREPPTVDVRAPRIRPATAMGGPVSPSAPTAPGSGQPPQLHVRPPLGMPPPGAPGSKGKRDRKAFFVATIATFVAVIAVATAAIVAHQHHTAGPSSRSTTQLSSTSSSTTQPASTSGSVPPVTAAQLDGLLLDAAAINAVMQTSGMTVTNTQGNTMWAITSIPDTNCLAIDHPAVEAVYAGSNWTAVRGNELRKSPVTHFVAQSVIAFPSAKAAAALYDASVRSWSSCSNRGFTDSNASSGSAVSWSVGSLSNQNETLAISSTQVGNPTWTLQRALTVKNNVVIDVAAACYSPSSQLATTIVEQIAANVPG